MLQKPAVPSAARSSKTKKSKTHIEMMRRDMPKRREYREGIH
jgi:hypothetical protein